MNRRAFIAAAAVVAARPVLSARLPAVRHRPVVVAHRGDHTKAHENSLAAIEAAIRTGADYVEVDVRRSRDGEHVLMHDATVDRTTTGHGKVADLHWSELAELRLADRERPAFGPEPVPRFTEVLRMIRGRIGLYLDFKDGDRAAVVRLLRESGTAERTIIYDVPAQVAVWRGLAPELPVMVSPRGEDLRRERWPDLKTIYPVEVLDGPATQYSAEVVTAVQALGFEVWMDIQGPWEDAEFWRRMLALGADGWQTDRPGELLAFLRASGKR